MKKELQRQRNGGATNQQESTGRSLWGLSGMRKSQSDSSGNLFQIMQHQQQYQQSSSSPSHEAVIHEDYPASNTSNMDPPASIPFETNSNSNSNSNSHSSLSTTPTTRLASSPGTPPKKIWEQKYRNFLQRGGGNKQQQQQPPLQAPNAQTMPVLPIPTSSSGTRLNHHDPLDRTRVAGVTAAYGTEHESTTSSPASAGGTNNTSGSEGSVRGGNFFSNVFSRGHHKDHGNHNNSNANHNNNSHDGKYGDSSSMPFSMKDGAVQAPNNTMTHRRRVKSFSHTDELDETKRRGSKKSSLKRVTSDQATAQRGVTVVTETTETNSNSNRQRAHTSESFLYHQQQHNPANHPDQRLHYPATLAVAAAEAEEEQEDYISTPVSAHKTCAAPQVPLQPLPPPLDTITGTDIQVDSNAYNSSNSMDLSGSSSSAMKKAFTEFHNSAATGQDSGRAYLGDDPSHKGHNLYWAPNQRLASAVFGPPPPAPPTQSRSSSETQSSALTSQLQFPQQAHHSHSRSVSASSRLGLGGSVQSHNNLHNLKSHFSISPSLETVQESVAIKSARILKPILGVDTWNNGRRYLIAPAALAACPLTVLTTLSGSADAALTAAQGAVRESAFGTIVLGEAVLSYMGANSHKSCAVQRWSSACLVLRQNYLLEYDNLSAVRGLPRGFCHLQYAVCHNHQDFPDALELHFYASPCAKADKRVLMIRVPGREQREYWKQCLNRAANLTLDDMFAYDAQTLLGMGQYASVHPARRKHETPSSESEHQPNNNGSSKSLQQQHPPPYNCALKIFDKKQFWRLVVKGQERADTLVRETSVQATLTAKCGRVASFLRLRGFFETADQIVLELELLEGTDLFQHISSKGVLSESEAGRILIDILKSLEAMKRIGLAHRDIKPANILMCHSAQQGPAAKVGDFGMSTFVDVDGQVRGRCGTPGYVAPEIFTAGVHGGYGNKVDVFSAGVTLYVMLCGYEPFYGETDAELVAANKAALVEFTEADWAGISMEARDMVKKMMHPDPAQRLDAKAALGHPWLRRLDKDSDALDQSLSLPKNEAPVDDACVIS